MNTCVLIKNFWKYDNIQPKPTNFPENIDLIYLSDNIEYYNIAKNYGYISYMIDNYINITDNFERRKIIAYINCYPEKVLPQLEKYDYVFICDSNIINFDKEYYNFINLGVPHKALYITSGWYTGEQNTLDNELKRSLCSNRWSYNFKNIIESYNKYEEILQKNNIDIKKCVVCSAKYIGWNIKSIDKEKISSFVYNEYLNNLQGNIIFSVALKLFSSETYHFVAGFFNGKVQHHNLSY